MRLVVQALKNVSLNKYKLKSHGGTVSCFLAFNN